MDLVARKSPLFDPAKLEALKNAHDAYNANHVPYWTEEYHRRLPRSMQLGEAFGRAHSEIFEKPFSSAWDAFWDDDYSKIDIVIQFLGENQVFFRSGYMKEAVLRKIKLDRLKPDQMRGLRSVIIGAIETCGRREFKRYCTMASRLADESLIESVKDRLISSDRNVQWRARRMLEVMEMNRTQNPSAYGRH